MVIARGVEHRPDIEAREQHRGGATEQGAVQPDAETVGVEQREREHEAIVTGPAPRETQCLHGREQVPVGEHCALRRASGTGGVAQESEITRATRVEYRRSATRQVDVGAYDERVG